MTAEVIEQVEGEFRARGFSVTLSKPSINQYVALNMIDTFCLARGYEGAMPHAAFELLVLAAESFIKIKQVNSKEITWNMLMIMFNELYGVTSLEKRVKETMFERGMRATNVSLNASMPELEQLSRSKNQPYHNQPLGTSLVDKSDVGRKGGSVCGDKK